SPLAVTLSTRTAAPVLAGVRLRAGRAGSAYCSAIYSAMVIAAVIKARARFSFAIARNSAVDAAIAAIPDDQYTPVRYPGAVLDPDTGELISHAQVAEAQF